MDGASLGSRSLRWASVAVVAGAILLLSLWPADPAPGPGPAEPARTDLLFHALAFALLSSLSLWALDAGPSSPRRWRLALLGVLVLYGLLIELIQIPVPGRGFELGDLAADVLGILVPWALFAARVGAGPPGSRAGDR